MYYGGQFVYAFPPREIEYRSTLDGVHENDDLTEYIIVLPHTKADHQARARDDIA